MTDEKIHNVDAYLQATDFPHQHVRASAHHGGFSCLHCGTKRTLADDIEPRDFGREAHDFLLRHARCPAPKEC